MELYNYFIEEYELINANDNNAYVIDAFLDYLEEGKEPKYSKPLKAVFIHKTKNEMFLVLDCLKQDLEFIKNVCDEWERKVLNFVNLSKEFRDNIEYLKYNISLLILCKDNAGNEDDNFRFETEKSTKICRKIFLLCNDKGEIGDDDKAIIPFYFAPVESIDNSKTEKLERELDNLLSKDAEIQYICKKEELTLENIKKMYGWLSENDNN